MLKHILLLILLSALVVFWGEGAASVFQGMSSLYAYVSGLINIPVANASLASALNRLVTLFTVPFLFGLAVALACWLLKKSKTNMVPAVVWSVWLVLVVMLVA